MMKIIFKSPVELRKKDGSAMKFLKDKEYEVDDKVASTPWLQEFIKAKTPVEAKKQKAFAGPVAPAEKQKQEKKKANK